MAAQTLNISLPAELIAEIDEQARVEYSSRSEYIRRAVVRQLRTEQALARVFDEANARGRAAGFTTEQQVYDALRS